MLHTTTIVSISLRHPSATPVTIVKSSERSEPGGSGGFPPRNEGLPGPWRLLPGSLGGGSLPEAGPTKAYENLREIIQLSILSSIYIVEASIA